MQLPTGDDTEHPRTPMVVGETHTRETKQQDHCRSQRGKFVGHAFRQKNLHNNCGIELHLVTAANLQANAVVETTHQVTGNMLRMPASHQPRDKSEQATKHSS